MGRHRRRHKRKQVDSFKDQPRVVTVCRMVGNELEDVSHYEIINGSWLKTKCASVRGANRELKLKKRNRHV